mmetsp:Transcript_24779/g.57563  ORF Transcript_24779/g.57563 Transcript_24779/m.57563 type:complete len:389 (-) Transcript_24779:199-1365(-)|eukprot:CAMPEP_0171118886 /NCGR_PEP_ID=MMETSP0766_2-20121228/95810_1 /TAXON_ID=439317 /ORGANISM="Gambierdiscus australes, Strain CAWD 149" /LENGTH=388 /DNA_ID=CAMNT_0011581505 /DNA_START=210 /DNA_END=1376 /DNA_ORIENTATION=+
MAEFFRLQDRIDDVIREYFRMAQEASDQKTNEVAAVIKIQSVFRASQVRKWWYSRVGAALLIQRVIRGWLARARTKNLRLERSRQLNMLFFHHCAAVIQKFFRGWWSRRHLHDYYGRKQYLATVALRGEWTTDYLKREHQQKLEEAKIEEEKAMRREFDTLAGELHHLVSTKSIAGVYNPPYNEEPPAAFEKSIEQHLRDSCRVQMPRSLRRPRHRVVIASASPQGRASQADWQVASTTAAGPPQDLADRSPHVSRSASVGRMQKIQGPFRSKEQIEVANVKASTNFRTLQASGRYDAVESDRKMQAKLSKLTRISPIDFVAPGLPAERPPPSSVHAHAPFRECPVEMRSDYVELPKIRDKPPFFTAVPRDKHFSDYNEQPLVASGHV